MDLNPNDIILLKNADLYSAVIGLILPIILASIMNSAWDRRLQVVTMLVAVGISAGITVFFTKEGSATLMAGDWARFALLTGATATISYRHIWKPLGVDGWLKDHFLNKTPPMKVDRSGGIMLTGIDTDMYRSSGIDPTSTARVGNDPHFPVIETSKGPIPDPLGYEQSPMKAEDDPEYRE